RTTQIAKDARLKDPLLPKASSLRPLQKISATKLQSYLDCPRQYFYKYVDPKLPYQEFEHHLLPKDLGILEHRIIERYCKMHHNFDEVVHQCFSQQQWDLFLKEKNLVLEKQ